ncbi:putative tail fiber protein [Klebsiella phage vB_KaeD_HazelMika]|nr:putative tail fiber protein [Klebsiella phage vB_KaeD_HazelMika]
MAIYRTGTASLNAQGVIVGVGTNWQDKLSLVRVGATMIFQTAPLTICTISSIVSPTEMRATATDGAVVAAGTKYVILLHDSITVDGLAQDVAETLRYYQSKETVIEDAIEFFQNFDWERIVAVGNQVKADAQTASTAATNAKTSETNSKASENAAKASQTAAAASQTAAKTSETNAKASETAAKNSQTAAASSATAAAGSASAASGSATAAKTSETNAKTSETNANSSKVAAAASQTAAAGSASAAATSATAAKTSETNAKTSETNAASSKTAAAASATTATQQADRAKTEADRAATANPDNQLKKANNLSDVANMTTARQNLQIDKILQTGLETIMYSPDGKTYLSVKNGVWGCWNTDISGYLALGLNAGGTGAKDAAGARTNLEIDKFGLGLSTSSGLINSTEEGSSTGLANGFYTVNGDYVGAPFGIGNGQFLGVLNFNCTQGNNYKFQLAGSYSSGGRLMFRNMNNGNYNPWKEVVTSVSPTITYGITMSRPDYSQTAYIGVGGADVYFTNTQSGKALQLNNNGNLTYSDRIIIEGANNAMVIGTGKTINDGNLVSWIRGMRDSGGSRVIRNDQPINTGGANYQYNANFYMNAGDCFGMITVDYRNANLYVSGGNNGGVNSGTVQVNALWGTKNTTVDANGFIKRASPVIKVMASSFETNEESEGCTVERIDVGVYKIYGCIGLNADLAWGGVSGGIEIPVDINKQPLLWVDYSVDFDGSLVLKTYHRTHESAPKFAQNNIDGYSNGDPIDIPSDTFVSVRVQMPEDSIYNKEIDKMERDVASYAAQQAWSKAHETGCEEE